MKFMKSHPPKLYISQNTEGTWFVRLGEEKKKKSVKAENLHILIFSRAVVNFFLSTKSQWCQSGNVPNYIIWSFFFSFWWFLRAKNLIDGNIYFIWGRGDRWKMTNVRGPRFENNLWLKTMTKASHCYELSKGKDLGFMWQRLKFCTSQVTMNIFA